MIVWSIAGHVVLLVIGLLWGGPRVNSEPRIVMTISLGGAPGPKTGGQTQIGGQAVQAAPPQEPVKPLPAPPAAKAPAMSLPDPRSRPPRQQPKQAPPDATAKTPNTGEVPREGSTRVDTRVREVLFVPDAGHPALPLGLRLDLHLDDLSVAQR